ncbi:MAG: hypothetical protein A2049_09525 [Elusimicrobia bacterium GWA2_62_23]|nr:MAG: hypothetical protein A2049_09525 [Elusimicrobia bacterium GWA2_62_23]
MKKLLLIILVATIKVSMGYAADRASGEQAKQAGAGNGSSAVKKFNSAVVAEKAESREELVGLVGKLHEDIEAVEVNRDLLKAVRDKSIDWKTRFLLLERVEAGDKKKITREQELGLYSDALLDTGEHKEVRKRAAQALMEPSRTEPKARKALEKAAKDKSLPGDVLWSVMVSVGSSGIDDVDALAGLMNREPKTNNDIGINLNAVRALGQSKDPRAIGMLFKILDESQPDSFFNMTALEQLSFIIRRGPEQMEKLRPMLTPRLMKLLDDRSYIGASRQKAARMLLRMNERKAIPLILKWVKPKEEGGGDETDITWAFDILAEFNAKEVIPDLQEAITKIPNDSRWEDNKKVAERLGKKYPEGLSVYKGLQECLKKLKGEPYDKKHVGLPWEYD